MALTDALVERGHGVTVVMTASARRFVGPATFAALSGRPVGTRLFGPEDRAGYGAALKTGFAAARFQLVIRPCVSSSTIA